MAFGAALECLRGAPPTAELTICNVVAGESANNQREPRTVARGEENGEESSSFPHRTLLAHGRGLHGINPQLPEDRHMLRRIYYHHSLVEEDELRSLIGYAKQTAQLMLLILVDPSRFFYDAKDLARWMAALDSAIVLAAGSLKVWILEQGGPISLPSLHVLNYYSNCEHV